MMKEKLKSLVLILLLISTVILLYLSLTLGVMESGLGMPATLYEQFFGKDITLVLKSQQYEKLAFPRKIAVLGNDGLYLCHDYEQYNDGYSKTYGIIDEAIGSCGECVEITEQEYMRLLQTLSIIYYFDAPVPFSLLRSWAGANEGSFPDLSPSTVAISIVDDQVLLLLSGNGGYYRFSTAAAATALSELAASTHANADFAQNLGFSALAGDEPLLISSAPLPYYSFSPPAYATTGELSREVLSTFSFNSYLTKVYEDSSSNRVYVEGHNILTVNDDGHFAFSSSQGEGIAIEHPPLTSYDQRLVTYCEAVRSILFRIWALTSDMGQLSLSSINYDSASDNWDFSFSMHIGGTFVDRAGGGSWAHATVSQGAITEIAVYPAAISLQDYTDYLPYIQAAAALSGDDMRLNVRYRIADDFYLPVMCAFKEGE